MDAAIREAIDKIAVQSGQRAAARLIRLRATCGEPLTVEEIDAAEIAEREAVRQRLTERIQSGGTLPSDAQLPNLADVAQLPRIEGRPQITVTCNPGPVTDPATNERFGDLGQALAHAILSSMPEHE